ncbi:hypothetical protein M947_09775 [Sulfurimonas hongkongensis]|uniref:Uncharacterized protein n=1 Tax=Sulfurimonas hongkongensis TaxID=1172190 RepID=T0J3H8_9BACT|nr:hypothetical protein [Sulfurimonas hongkongensis]EQB35560.1 hypothetical protein M947_09775 [Sulfurimonas hongkongensis]
MREFVKFENLEEVFSDLSDVLKNSLQRDILSIKKLVKDSKKFKSLSSEFPKLKDAEYVIFSEHMKGEFHESESYIFVDAKGRDVCNISGREMDLYEMITDCKNLIEKKHHNSRV